MEQLLFDSDYDLVARLNLYHDDSFFSNQKGVPAELLEAATLTAVQQVRAFFSITVPYIKGTVPSPVVTTIKVYSA